MKPNSQPFSFLLRLPFLLLCTLLTIVGFGEASKAWAVPMLITYTDADGEGFRDATRGAQRRAAFKAVVDNWGKRINGTVTIEISASFDPLGPNDGTGITLAEASPYTFRRDWSDFFNRLPAPQRSATFYPIALANQQAGKDLDEGHPDMVVTCNSDVDTKDNGFYYGLNGDVPSPNYDFYSVLYHEVGHGLGFTSSFNSDGTFGLEAGYANIFDVFLAGTVNGTGQYLTKVTDAQRAAVMRSGQMWFAGTNATLGKSDASCRIYAPNPYEDGSSVSHLDEATFHGAEELMTPKSSEPIHAPGRRVTGVFKDMGWDIKPSDITGPTLTLSYPSKDTPVNQSLTDIRGTVSDSGSGMGRVFFNLQRASDNKFWNGADWVPESSLLKATITDNNWKYTNVPRGTNLPFGNYAIYLRAIDTANIERTLTSTFTVTDVSAPTVTIGNPSENVGYKTAPIAAGTATENTDYVKLAIRNSAGAYWDWTANSTGAFGSTTFVDPTHVKRVDVPPTNWSFQLPTTLPEGDYILFASGVNTTDVGSQYVPRPFTIDKTGPQIQVTAPGHTASVSALTAISGTATDRSGIYFKEVKFTLYQNGQYWNGTAWTSTQTNLVATVEDDGTWTYTKVPTGSNLRAGVYYISANAVDAIGNLSTPTPGANQTNFRVDANPPTCTITSPQNNASVTTLTSIAGTAGDDIGIDRVSLYILRLSDSAFWDGTAFAGGGSAILSVNYNPSTKVWQSNGRLPGTNKSDPARNWSNGDYDIIAIAYDTAGNQTRADSIVSYHYSYLWTGATMRDNDQGNNSNNWDTAANWYPPGVPGAEDDASIRNGDTVQADGSHSVKSLTIINSTLNTTGLLVKNLDLNGTINGGAINSNGGTWNWNSGNIAGTWTVFAGATFNIAGTTQKDLLTGGVINNFGKMSLGGTGVLRGVGGCVINNKNGATFTVKKNGALFTQYNGNNRVNNEAGAVLKKEDDVANASSVSTFNGWRLYNSGTVGANNGTLEFSGNEELVFETGSSVSGTSRTQLSSGALVTNGTATIRGTTFDMTGGELRGPGTLTTSSTSTFNWSGGTIYRLSIGTGTKLNISGTSGKDIGTGGVISSSGSTTFSGGSLRGVGNSTFNNLKGAVFTNTSDAPFTYYNGNNNFNNAAGATFEKTVGTSTTSSYVNWTFNNSGTVRATQGVLALASGGNDAGTFTSNGTGIIRFVGGTHTLRTGTLFNGTGKNQLAGGILSVTGNAVIGSTSAATTFEISGGGITGTAVSNFTSYGTVNWTGGNIAGKFTVAPKSTLNTFGDGLKDIGTGGTINNSGLLVWKGPGVIRGVGNSTINNLSGGFFDIQADGPLFTDYNGNNVFNQAVGGTFRKSKGSGTSIINTWTTNINGGAFTVYSGTLKSQSALNINGPTNVSGNGTLQLSGTSTLKNVVTSAMRVLLDGSLQCFQPTTGAAPSHYKGTGLFDWQAGNISGTLAFDQGTKINLSGDALKDIGTGGIINNFGTFKWLGKGPLRGVGNSTFNNQSPGVFEIAADGGVFTQYNGNNVFNNLPGSTFKKSAGGGTSGVGSWTYNFKGGPITIATGTLQAQSPWNISAPTSLSGAGTLRFSNATTLGSTLTSASRVIHEGVLIGTGTARYAGAGIMDWIGGAIQGTFALNAGSKINLTGGSLKDIGTKGVINNSGTFTWSGGPLRGIGESQFNNLTGGTFDIVGDGGVLSEYNRSNVFNNNAGATFRKSGGTGVSNVGGWTFNQSGTIRTLAGVAPATGAALEFNAVLNLSGGTMDGTRSVRFNGSNLTVAGTPAIAGPTFELFGGTVSGTGSVATSGTGVLKWTGGSISQLTTAKGATLLIAGANQHDINTGGVLTNNGNATWTGGNIRGVGNSVINNGAGATFTDTSKASFVDYNGGNQFKNAGTFSTGAPIGKTAMSWGFTQLSTGLLNLDVNSTTAFDQWATAGSTLAGTLKIVRLGTFKPTGGVTFKFMTAGGISGKFSSVQNTVIDTTRSFQVVYGTNDVTLKVVAKASSPQRQTGSASTPVPMPTVAPEPPQVPTPAPAPPQAPSASLVLSAGSVNSGASSIQLNFMQNLEAAAATDLTHYSVFINGQPVELNGAVVKGNSVTLLLPEGVLDTTDSVTVKWNGLKSRSGVPYSSGIWNNGVNPS